MRGRPWASLVAISTLACLLLAGRMVVTGRPGFSFLVWNLALAWVPAVISAGIREERPVRSWALCALWLPFFPNAPYILTDLVHLRARAHVPIWFDAAMLAGFGIAGLLLAVASLGRVHRFVAARHGEVWGWIGVTAACGLAGLGIYVGRTLRWNTWDLVVAPRALLSEVAHRLASPDRHPGAWGVSLVFGALLLAVYLSARSLSHGLLPALRQASGSDPRSGGVSAP